MTTEKGTIDFRITNIIENLSYIPGVILKQDIEVVLDSYREVESELAALKAENERLRVQTEITISRQKEEIESLVRENERLKEENEKMKYEINMSRHVLSLLSTKDKP